MTATTPPTHPRPSTTKHAVATFYRTYGGIRPPIVRLPSTPTQNPKATSGDALENIT
ncbi:hypothetical protein M407DRAFT_22915 [Tulasnella calospora MUT 4182]|uniref:Uncharacterized protein n=1 Tax=Tulasnella calospora MUT 4182 TaxID=1051891 RepID=A0A0C3M2F7_9AGAM|nr:hypothetical protein M407DRAFT_22915 [Tulasnella calospora MUT 4182]